jgi:hypothetical protein
VEFALGVCFFDGSLSGNYHPAVGVYLAIRRRTAGLISIAIVIVVAFFFVPKHYRATVLTPADITVRQPKPPELPQDCGEIRRAMALSTASIVAGHEKPVRIVAPLDADEAAIYKAVLDQWNAGQPTALNVSATTFSIDLPLPSEERECGCAAGLSAESLLKASHSYHLLTSSDLPGKHIRLINPHEQSALIVTNDPGNTIREGKPINQAVEAAFASGLFSLSEIAFDQEHRHAIVRYAFHCGTLCGNGGTWVFEKVNGKWKKTDSTCGGWVS